MAFYNSGQLQIRSGQFSSIFFVPFDGWVSGFWQHQHTVLYKCTHALAGFDCIILSLCGEFSTMSPLCVLPSRQFCFARTPHWHGGTSSSYSIDFMLCGLWFLEIMVPLFMIYLKQKSYWVSEHTVLPKSTLMSDKNVSLSNPDFWISISLPSISNEKQKYFNWNFG